MRLGAHLYKPFESPDEWVQVVRSYGYSAAYCPVGPEADDATVAAYARAAAQNDIVIAEVGAWSNPIDNDPAVAKAAIDKCKAALDLAERIGARCCVNIAGSKDKQWDGPSAANFSDECFDQIVQTTREIIDAVKPTHSFYTLETMPWIFPESPESYLRLVQAIDRPACAVHLDPVNMINGVKVYFNNAELLRESFRLLGPRIRSCHAKDIALERKLTLHLNECRPGLGGLDYGVYLRELSKLDRDVCLMIEHLPNEEEYVAAAQHIRQVAADNSLAFV